MFYAKLMENEEIKYAPIVVFAFNRLDTLRQSIASLLCNSEAEQSDLYVFVDGARTEKEGEAAQVEEVKAYVKTITGFRTLHYEFADHNKGLGNSIISGVTSVINSHGTAIIIEDDLIVAPNFLWFMNEGLKRYQHKKQVFSVCGYNNIVQCPDDYHADAYFCTRSSSWGWATWQDRWEAVDWQLSDWTEHKKQSTAFNKWGGSDCFKLLNDWHCGKNRSWAIRFCYTQFLQNGVSLFPIRSLVRNDGFDGRGTNCKAWSRFKYDFDNRGLKNLCLPEDISINKTLQKEAMKYHSIAQRIYSRLMYLLH